MSEEIILEATVPFPINLSLKKMKNDRYELIVNDKVFNFFEKEQLYLHVDQGNLGMIVTKTKKVEGIFKKLKKMIPTGDWWEKGNY